MATSGQPSSGLAFWSDDFLAGTRRAKLPAIADTNTVPFLASPNVVSQDASKTAALWLANPANKMQLPSMQQAFDVDGGGISMDEWRGLLKAAGSSASAEALFAQMDKDGDGQLTEAEIKTLRDVKRSKR